LVNGKSSSSSATTSEIILDSHEDRLQRVESSVSDLRTDVARMSGQVENLGQQMAEGNARVIEKLQNGFSRLDGLSQTVQAHSEHIERLRNRDAGRLNRDKSIRKVMMALVLAVGGAIAGKVGDYIWTNALSVPAEAAKRHE
jgi:chromosome segregation ATPase